MGQPELDTRCGRLRGALVKSIEGVEYNSFKGIPFAKPPIGQLRFRDPVPVEPWEGTKEALEYGPMCHQVEVIANIKGGSEDCLYLNVFTKSTDPKSLRPVMVWIHGGGFIFGSGNDLFYGPDYFMNKDVVLVTINYRLGIFGFLNLKHKEAPGNQGLKDQVMALQWVRDNIANFGGDPQNVTIFGESAGSASVHYLTLSPLAKGLFHKAISQSGVAINPWASVFGDPKQYAIKLCELLGHKVTDDVETVKYLRTVDATKLMEIQFQIGFDSTQPICLSVFGPGTDDSSPNPFMPIPIDKAAENGVQVPYLIGHNNREGILLLKIFEKHIYEKQEMNFDNFVHPRTLEKLRLKNLTVDDFRRTYLKNEEITKENTEKLVDLISDSYFTEGIHKIIETQVKHNSAPTYMYHLTYDQGSTLPKLMFDNKFSGASHFDDILYLFNQKFLETLNAEPLKKDSPDYKVMQQMIELWTNFARTGRPTPEVSQLVPLYWLPVHDGTVFRHLNIGEELRMEQMLNINKRFLYKTSQ